MSFNALASIDLCDVENRVGLPDKRGSISVAVTSGVRCRIDRVNKKFLNVNGEDVLSQAVVFFRKTCPIRDFCRLYFDGRWHDTLEIDPVSAKHALHHFEVWVS